MTSRQRPALLLTWGIPLLMLAACSSELATTPTLGVFTAPSQTRAAQAAQAASPAAAAPAGWPVYRGTRVPFLIAYPPDWGADPTNAPVGEITFAPARDLDRLSATIRTSQPSARPTSLALLRDRLVSQSLRSCEEGKVIEGTAEEVFAGQTFATATARCGGEEDEALQYYLGVARVGDAEWDFVFRSTPDQFATNRDRIFTPMLRTLTFYGAP